MTNPVITIAMPFYNSAATLELCIRSLLNQSYGDFELLLCDDGSDDQGLAIAHSFDDPRVICWSDGRRLRLAARLNECIDRARGSYLARMDADDIAYPDRFARQLAFLGAHTEVDLCSAGAMVFGKHGRPLWRFSPAQEHAGITRSPFRGFPLWHPLWMGHIEWFRRWRYEETAWQAQDQELLLRSYRLSRFANLPQVLLGYRRERVTLKKLFRYKVLHIQYVCRQSGAVASNWQKLQLLVISAVRFAANCTALLGGFERRFGHQAAKAPTVAELAEWRNLWNLLSAWYGRPSSETFLPSVAATRPQRQAGARMKIAHVLTRGDVLGGAQSHVRELSLQLRSLGHEVTVITGAPGIFTDQLRQAGIPWLQVRSLVRPLRPHLDLAALVQLWCVLRDLKPDLVCAHTAKAGSLGRAAARLHHIPSVFTPHGWSMLDRTSLKSNPLFCWAEYLAGRLGTCVINVCEFEREFARQFGVCPAEALEMVHNGIAENPLARLRPIDAQPPLLVMVARFAPQKDHATLLQALSGLLIHGMALAAGGGGRTGSPRGRASGRAWTSKQGPYTAARHGCGPFAHGSTDLRAVDPLRGVTHQHPRGHARRFTRGGHKCGRHL